MAVGLAGSKAMSWKTSSLDSKPTIQVGLVSSRAWLNTAQLAPKPRYSNPPRVGPLNTRESGRTNGLPPFTESIPYVGD